MPGLPRTAGLPPVPATRQRPRFPGSSTSRSFLRVVPVSDGETFSTPFANRPQEVPPIYFRSFLNPHDVHRMRAVIRTYLGLSTSLCTSSPQVTGCDLRATIIGIALCNRLVLIVVAVIGASLRSPKARSRNLRPTAPYALRSGPASVRPALRPGPPGPASEPGPARPPSRGPWPAKSDDNRGSITSQL